MTGVPNIFANASATIPLVQLDQNFATPITLGTTTAGLGNTVTTLNGLTLGSTTIATTQTQNNSTTALATTAFVNGTMLFSAYMSANQSPGATGYTKLAFDTTTLNVGTCFSTSTNSFTAPWAGWYEFSGQLGLASSMTNGEVQIDFVPSTAVVANLFHFNPASGLQGFGASRLVKLAQGETVFMRFYSGVVSSYTLNGTNTAGACFFSGRWVGA